MAIPYEIFVGLRYLRAKRRNRTISLNTFVSVTGITLGVAALIGTVGIMTGFKEDIQAKILGTTAHIIVQDRMKDGMSDYDAVAKQLETVPDVVAVTPFILKQVMLTTQGSAQGVVLRGIDPEREGFVTALAHNMVSGRLEDLSQPIAVKLPPPDNPSGPLQSSEKPGIILGQRAGTSTRRVCGGYGQCRVADRHDQRDGHGSEDQNFRGGRHLPIRDV